MRYIYIKPIFSILLFLIISSSIMAQSLPIGTVGDDYFRVLQLQGKLDPNISFTSRPNFLSNKLTRDSFYKLLDTNLKVNPGFKKGIFEIRPMLVNFRTQYNSLQPYGWNDEGMIKAKGIQTLLRIGVYTRIGPLHIQFVPERVSAENAIYDISSEYGSIPRGRMDQNFVGQSSARLNLGPLSLGLSNENLYWGPGQYSSVIMSNNAPGFMHYTFNTTRPLKTPLGSVEFQLVTGRLKQSDTVPFEVLNLKEYRGWHLDRIFNGLNITFQPKLLPHFFIGINRAYQYSENLEQFQGGSFMNKFLPVFSAVFKSSLGGTGEDLIQRDQQLSLFTRWLFPKSHAEFYFEYGWNDHSYNFRDFWIDPEHAAIYIVGFKKLMPINNKKWIEVNTEIIQTAQTTDYLVRTAGDWYIYENGGYNNNNQILGAGSGVGNNVQTLQLNLLDGLSKWGIKIQRIQNQPVPAIAGYAFESLGLRTLKWTDIAIGFNAQQRWKNLIIAPEVHFVNSMNYAWLKKTNFNLFAQLNMTYLW